MTSLYVHSSDGETVRPYRNARMSVRVLTIVPGGHQYLDVAERQPSAAVNGRSDVGA